MIVVNRSKLVVCSQFYRAKKIKLSKKKVFSYKLQYLANNPKLG